MFDANRSQEDMVKRWTSIDEALDFAIGEEEAAADFYTRLAGQTKVPGMKQTLEGFAREEMSHKAKLQAVKAGTVFASGSQRVPDLKISEYVVDVTPDPHLGYRESLVVAMKKEKAAFKLYTDLAETVANESVRALFLALAQEEAKHKLRFEVEYDELLTEN
jgi:rubrerythrin